ncbi:MAG: hydroxymethylglutaryl-CoA reductase, degradative [Candidatus Hodarchaeales archaeon]|jgi:hydroxymethylglutaryl-CoA reductase
MRKMSENNETERSSRIPGFYKLSQDDRREKVKEFSDLSVEDVELLKQTCQVLSDAGGENFYIENVIGVMQVPIGVATNFKVNSKDYLVPMAIEEASVVAAASNSAKACLKNGGFFTSSTGPIMIGQIQAVEIDDPEAARFRVYENKKKIIDIANEQDPILVKFGGGCRDINVKVVESITGPMVITELLVDCRDAMGANAVNTMAEAVTPLIEEITRGRVYLRIISNLADKRLVRARAIFTPEELATNNMSGENVIDGIIEAYAFADADPYRAATHNKGIMNGISAVVLATANDFRAVEAGAHTYAARTGFYSSLTTYEKDLDGNLVGTIEIPMAVGLVGGVTRIHPVAQVAIKILGVKTADELASVIASVGLAQNIGALRALATAGIQKGHMRLHARNIAADVVNKAGMTGEKAEELIDRIRQKMVEDRKVRYDRAEELLKEFTN